MLLMACGPASAQLVKVVSWQNGVPALAANVSTVTGIDLDDSTTVYVVGMYGDNTASASGFTAVTFGGVPPTGFIQSSGASGSRTSMAYWISPNTAAGQTLSFTYTSPNGGYYWAYQLSNVDTNAPVATSGATMPVATSTSLTTLTNNSFIISYMAGNNNVAANLNALTPNPPLTQTAVTIVNAPAGASMASATNSILTPGLQNISWNIRPGSGIAQYGVGAFAFQPLNVGAPIVGGSVSPAVTAPGADFILTVTIDPFHYGNLTNVSVDLSSIGGSSANALVQSSNPNVWTNSFIVPGGAPIGITNLVVTAKQDAAPITGSGSVAINIATPSAPVLVVDTTPTTFFNIYAGQGVTFSATFTAPGFITYQWQKSGDGITFTNIPGAANTTYTIPSATLGDTGYYQLQASNFLGSAVSTFTYILVSDATPAVYIWSAPIPFAGLSAEQILTNFPAANKIAGAMVARSSGNPISVILTNAGNQPVVFAVPGNWASLSGGVGYVSNVNTNQTGNSSFNSVLNEGYNNNAAHNITLGGLVVGQKYQVQLFALDNRSGLSPAGSLQLSSFQDPMDINVITSEQTAMADNVYMLGTFTAISNMMTIQQNLVSSAGNFNCLVLRSVGWTPPPYFTSPPKNTNNFIGTTVSFTASAAGDSTIASPTITYQWSSGPVGGPYAPLTDGSKYAGVATTTLIISNLVAGDANSVYVMKATNGGGTTTSPEARVYVQSLPVLQPINSFAGAVLALTNNPSSRLIGFWQLNEVNDPSTGLLIAYDASGKGKSGTYGATALNGYNSVLSPQPPTFNGFAPNQGALRTGAGGATDVSSMVNLPPLYITNGVATTICMWIYPTAVANTLGGLLYNRGGDQCGFGFANNTGGPSGQRSLGFVWNNSSGEATFQYNANLFPVNNLWNFVVLVMRTNAATFYLNYVDELGKAHFEKAADTAANYTQNAWSGGPITIGGDTLGNGNVFPGSIADVAVFNSALTDDQIITLFAAGYQVAGFPASIVGQPPANITNYAGFTVQISAQTGGTSPKTNQWSFNGTKLVDGWYNGSIISGSTSNVLTIQNVSTSFQGVYRLAVTNALGGEVSSDSTLVILTPSAPPAGNLVGRWLAGAQNLTDVSGYAPTAGGIHDGEQIMTNGVPRGTLTWTNDLPPKNSGGSSLNLASTGVQIKNTSLNDPGYVGTFDDGIYGAMTVSFWAKGWPGTWNPFVSKYGETTPTPAGGWQLRRFNANNTTTFTMRGTGATDDPEGSISSNDGQWHFYCGTYDVTTGIRALYVDGKVANILEGNGLYTIAYQVHLEIGARDVQPGSTTVSNLTTAFYTGRMYDVRIYNVAISGDQVAYLAATPALPALPLTVAPASGGNSGYMDLNWLNGGLLLQSSSVAGPWTTNQVATPPYRVYTTNGVSVFYRVLFPQ